MFRARIQIVSRCVSANQEKGVCLCVCVTLVRWSHSRLGKDTHMHSHTNTHTDADIQALLSLHLCASGVAV